MHAYFVPETPPSLVYDAHPSIHSIVEGVGPCRWPVAIFKPAIRYLGLFGRLKGSSNCTTVSGFLSSRSHRKLQKLYRLPRLLEGLHKIHSPCLTFLFNHIRWVVLLPPSSPPGCPHPGVHTPLGFVCGAERTQKHRDHVQHQTAASLGSSRRSDSLRLSSSALGGGDRNTRGSDLSCTYS